MYLDRFALLESFFLCQGRIVLRGTLVVLTTTAVKTKGLKRGVMNSPHFFIAPDRGIVRKYV
jgi:hypothetical protein